MPDKEDAEVRRHARRDAREGKAPTTQAGEFVREEIHHIRAGKHGARSTKQAIAIGLSKARRARAVRGALKREGRGAATGKALAEQARSSAGRRGAAARSEAARRGARTKGAARRSADAHKAARTRAKRRRTNR